MLKKVFGSTGNGPGWGSRRPAGFGVRVAPGRGVPARRCSALPDARGLGPQSGGPGLSSGAASIPQDRGRPADPPQRIGGRCGSRGSSEPTGTSPAPPAPAGETGDRETNGSAPRPSRREAESQRRLSAWFAALSRSTGVSRDQPLGPSRVQRREGGRMHSLSRGWSRLATPRKSRDSAAG